MCTYLSLVISAESKEKSVDSSPSVPRLASPLLVRSFEISAPSDKSPLVSPRTLSSNINMTSRRSMDLGSPNDDSRPFRLSKYDDIIPHWANLAAMRTKTGTKAGDILREHMSSWMKRPDQVTEEQLVFNSLFANECDRNNTILHTSKGKLEVGLLIIL